MSSVQLYTLRHLKAATRCDRHSINGDAHCLVVGTGHMKLDHQRLAVWATEMVNSTSMSHSVCTTDLSTRS